MAKTTQKTFTYSLKTMVIAAENCCDDSVIVGSIKAADVIAAFDAVVALRDVINDRNQGNYFIHSVEEVA